MNRRTTYDNYVQDPTCQQGFNRYAYCFYNPLKYIDPTGESCYGPSEAEKMQRAANEARQRCWNELYRYMEEVDFMYQSIKHSPSLWGQDGDGIALSNATFNEGNSAHESPKIVFPEGDKEAEAAYNAFRILVFSNDKYKNVQEELLRLEKADERFCIRMGENIIKEAGGGNFSYNITTGEFDINIDGRGDYSTMEKLAHELKHADQYMDGKLGFDLRNPNMVVQFAYDFLDEVEAFERQGVFGKTLDFDGIKNRYPDLWIKGCFDVNQTIWKCAYDNIQLPFNLIIKGNTDNYIIYNEPIYLYHGWQNDIP